MLERLSPSNSRVGSSDFKFKFCAWQPNTGTSDLVSGSPFTDHFTGHRPDHITDRT
jgi:hypothetical protein